LPRPAPCSARRSDYRAKRHQFARRLYRLTRATPIDLVARVIAVDSDVNVRFNRLIPGSLVIERAGAASAAPERR
jgi:hypothetical protein